MSMVESVEEQELRVTKYPQLRVLTGGKGPPEEPSTNWLKDFQIGTVFACRASVNTVDWEMYYLIHKFEKIYLLKWELPDGKIWERRVDPVLFCKQHKDYEVIAVQEPLTITESDPIIEAPEGDGNGNSDRPD